ncbi:putative histone H3 [Mycena olivaceomarginata]|nr:putative histone H3 [Mycena olivaceomarginata]
MTAKKHRSKVIKKTLLILCQYQTDLLIKKVLFQYLVQEVSQDYKVDIQFQSAAVLAFQEVAEAFLVLLFEDTNLTVMYSKHIIIQPKDMVLALHLYGDHNAHPIHTSTFTCSLPIC